jgi:hypothetical protein
MYICRSVQFASNFLLKCQRFTTCPSSLIKFYSLYITYLSPRVAHHEKGVLLLLQLQLLQTFNFNLTDSLIKFPPMFSDHYMPTVPNLFDTISLNLGGNHTNQWHLLVILMRIELKLVFEKTPLIYYYVKLKMVKSCFLVLVRQWSYYSLMVQSAVSQGRPKLPSQCQYVDNSVILLKLKM